MHLVDIMELLIFVQLIFLVVATIYDLKKGEIPPFIADTFLFGGLALGFFIFGINNLFIGLVVLAIGFGVYKLNWLGGGDVRILSGIAALFPVTDPGSLLYFFFLTCIFAIVYFIITLALAKIDLTKPLVIKFMPAILAAFVIMFVM